MHQGDPKKRISILGATGSIGKSTMDLILRAPEKYEVVALTGNNNVNELADQAIKSNANMAVTASTDQYSELKRLLSGRDIEVGAGEQAILEAAASKVDWSMAAIVGVAGLRPALKALEAAPVVALANKESLVAAGTLFMQKAREQDTKVLPVDSEHAAVFQCLQGETANQISKIVLTASGGPFRDFTAAQLETVTVNQALAHPNWEMGAKITIDSATMINKGLELIEAKFLFDLAPNAIEMVVHPQSIIHCLVNFTDGATLAQLSKPDMRVPISYALAWPERMTTPLAPINLAEVKTLTFEAGDPTRFPCLRLARETLEEADLRGPILNAANEVAVAAFLAEQIGFTAIPKIIEECLEKLVNHTSTYDSTCLNQILALDHQTRELANELLSQKV